MIEVLTTCGARSRVASPLVPVPFDARFTVTLPLCTPALAAVIPTLIALLLLPAARLTIGPPLPVAFEVVPTLALSPSWNPGATFVLAMLIAWLRLPPTCALPRLTLAGRLGCATWYTLPFTLIVCVGIVAAVLPKPLVPVPLDT